MNDPELLEEEFYEALEKILSRDLVVSLKAECEEVF
jgi:hypothetical protein